MKKICISANTSWYIYNFRATTITFLQEKGYTVFALAAEDKYSEKLEKMGCRVVTVKMNGGGRNILLDLALIKNVHSIFKKERPDIILNFTPKCNIYNAIAAKNLGIPFINNISGVGGQLLNKGLTSSILHWLYMFSQKYAHHTFFQNEDDMKLFLERKYLSRDKASRIMGSGVDLNRFNYREKTSKKQFKFLLVARMLKEKGIFEYVDAAKKMKQKYGSDVEFQLLGFLGVNNPSAIDQEQMNNWTTAGYVKYLGTSDTVEDIITESDCVVLPSYYGEGVPKSLIEAAALGRPIITTTHAGCRDVVDEGVNGYFCKPKSSDSLISACDTIYSLSEKARISMGRASHEKAKRQFSDQTNIALYFKKMLTLN